MRKFTQEDYDLVKNYEKDFHRAIYSRYVTGMSITSLETIARIYKETLNRNTNLSCGGCVLQMMTSVGRLYFSYKAANEHILTVEEVQDHTAIIKKENKRRKKNETQVKSKTGEGMPVTLSDDNIDPGNGSNTEC